MISSGSRTLINFYANLFNRDKSEVPESPAGSSDGYRTPVRAIRCWHAPGSPSLLIRASTVALYDSDDELPEVNEVGRSSR